MTKGRKRYPNHRLVKKYRNYTVEETAALFEIHKNTVRMWIKSGLQTIDDGRPAVILGMELIRYLQARRAGKKRPCRPGQMYCVKCRATKLPGAGMVEYQPLTEKLGNLTGICPDCNSVMHRILTSDQAREYLKKDETFPQALSHIAEINQPPVNSDLRGDVCR